MSHDPEIRETIPFDRRRARRRIAAGTVMATMTTPDGASTLIRVRLQDISSTGVGLRSDTPLPNGTVVAVYSEGSRFPSASGMVVRCLPMGNGYRVGLDRRLREVA